MIFAQVLGTDPPPTSSPDWLASLPGIERGAADIIRALNPPPVYRPPQMPAYQMPPAYQQPQQQAQNLTTKMSNTTIALAVGGGAVLLIGVALLLRR